jgi:hypothetical protein
LLLCCTVGAGSFLDNSDKSSLSNRKVNRNSRASSQQTKEKSTEPKVVPPIITNPTELDSLSADKQTTTPPPTTTTTTTTTHNNINTNHNAISTESDESSTSPISLPPQTSPVVSCKLKKKKTIYLELMYCI